MHVCRNSLPTATGDTAAALGYINMLPAELLVVLSRLALQKWRGALMRDIGVHRLISFYTLP